MRHVDGAQRGGERELEQGARDGRRRVHPARRAALQDHGVERGRGGRLARERRGGRPRIAEPVGVARALGERDERELARGRVDRSGGGLAPGADRRLAAGERDQRDRELVHPVGAHESRDLGVREARPQPRLARERERLREHRPGVPVDVAEAALGVAPAGAPGHAGDDERGRLARRGRPDLQQRVSDRVVPVDSVGEAVDAAGRDVQLEREAPAGRAGRAQQQRRAVLALDDAHDARREVQQPRERGNVEGGRRSVPGEHGGRGGGRRRPVARQLERRQSGRVRLAGRRATSRSRSGRSPAARADRRPDPSTRARASTRSGGDRAVPCRQAFRP